MKLKPDQFYVVLPISNPLLWNSRINLADACIRHLLASGVNIIIVECAYGNRDYQLSHWHDAKHHCTDNNRVIHVPVRAKTLVWTKECLINIGFAHAPDHAEYLGWFDADIEFRSPTWVMDTLNALQIFDFVQPWSDCYDLGPKGEHMDPVHRSFARIWVEGKPIMQGPQNPKAPYKFAHPGYAWAARREALQIVGGLMDTAALGAADHHMAMALIGRVKDSIPTNINPAYSRPLYRWEERAKTFGGNLGYVPGTLIHSWHGKKPDRRYVDRWQILIENDFNPDEDLKRNLYNVYELAGNKPRLRREFYRYFATRNEDSTDLF